jgi:hypothetical protein
VGDALVGTSIVMFAVVLLTCVESARPALRIAPPTH